MQSQPVEEFLKTLNTIDPAASKYFVIDKERSWYEHSFTQIVCRFHSVLAQYEDVVLIGNSMGGFGAMLFSGLLPNVRVAIAFTPQFSVAPRVTKGNEKRFDKFLGRIDSFSIDHACLFPAQQVRRFIVSARPRILGTQLDSGNILDPATLCCLSAAPGTIRQPFSGRRVYSRPSCLISSMATRVSRGQRGVSPA